ncbi:hypothetical protein [Streptomyces sp. CC208A]|uniref:hypothetical protein n=1 Tax=Streptomyces sp. CC208A TaxID=3044573 RepID=UPI0024A93DA5|nr:hypothetical protein [Streptomyces sp. CC208A]
MIIDVVPPDRIGPITLGMTIDDAEAAFRTLEGFQGAEESRVPVRGQANYDSGMSIHAHVGSGGLVNAIEVFRPHRTVSLRLYDIDVFGLPADDVVERLRQYVETEEEEGGCMIVAPSLLIALWRPFVASDESDEQGFFMQSLTLARPGYYD